MRLKSTLSKASGQNTQLMRQYRYSPAGNLTEKETGHGSYTYQYDKLYRLIQVENPTQNDESYTYGFLGNRLSSSSTTGTWNYDANNELLGYDSVSFTYDANGNTIQKDDNGVVTDYSYNVEDRLVEVTTNNPQPTTSNYYYVPLERRLWKEVGGIRTYFVYSDEGLAGEYDSGGQEIRTYGWIPGSGWSTDPLFVRIGGIYYWYRNDHLGAPQKIVTTSGAVVWSAIYDSFGKCHIATETITNNLRFPGQYHDSETGLYYNLNRYYDPTTGRYLRADPFGDGINLYTYCFNNPLLFIDPEGLCVVRKVGIYLGAGYGEEAALWYAERYNETGNPVYFVGGLFASLWTPDTWLQTVVAIATIPAAAERIAAAGLRSVYAAGRAALGEIVEQGVGIPVPGRGRFVSRSGGEILEGATWHEVSVAPRKGKIKWCQRSQRWRDSTTGRYVRGPKMPRGFGKPSTWVEVTGGTGNAVLSVFAANICDSSQAVSLQIIPSPPPDTILQVISGPHCAGSSNTSEILDTLLSCQ